MKQEEEPTVLEAQVPIKTRPFFSIIISCYNSRKTLGTLLESIVNQHMGHDIEVVISDDHSTERYDDIIALYDGKLDFVFTQTEYNCCPGNTREAGAQAATGEWITFADHDDAFIEDVYCIVQRYEICFVYANKMLFYTKNCVRLQFFHFSFCMSEKRKIGCCVRKQHPVSPSFLLKYELMLNRAFLLIFLLLKSSLHKNYTYLLHLFTSVYFSVSLL